MKHGRLRGVALVVVAGLGGCRSGSGDEIDAGADETAGEQTGSESESGSGDSDDVPPPSADLVGRAGLRRLTIAEYDATVRDLLDDDTAPARAFLPEDIKMPFDNDYETQVVSSALIDGAEALAHDVAERFVADAARRDAIVGCTPSGADDVACMESFVRAFGRRALRRPLADDEVAELMTLHAYATETGDFWVGAETIVRALLQHPELLYRVEIGEPVPDEPGLHRLGNHELVTRLSYLLWGTTPSDALLDAADDADAADRRFTSEDVRELAIAMLADERAAAQVDRFHALWLGYEAIPYEPVLAASMRAETLALVRRIVFEDRRAWTDLFAADETFVTPSLAMHYGLPAPTDPQGGWVGYAGTDRAGLLSHGSFLSNGVTAEDTRPVQRGLVVRKRMLCQEIPPPPPNVDVDDLPPSESPCKWDLYAPHREPGCVECHGLVNPIGWAFEQYDEQGRFRELDDAGCEIAPHTSGEIAGIGTFSTPGELGRLLAGSDALTECFSEQLYRFAMGRAEIDAEDDAIIEAWLARAGADFRLDDLLVEFVADEAFLYRREPQTDA